MTPNTHSPHSHFDFEELDAMEEMKSGTVEYRSISTPPVTTGELDHFFVRRPK